MPKPEVIHPTTDKINEVDFSSKESKPALKQFLLQLPPVIIDKLYDAHVENENTLDATFNNEEVKKEISTNEIQKDTDKKETKKETTTEAPTTSVINLMPDGSISATLFDIILL